MIFWLMALSVLKTSAQSPMSYTIQNISGSATINCAVPSIHLRAYSTTTNPALTCTWTSSNNSLTGRNVFLSSPGIYTITAFMSGTLSLPAQTLSIYINTVQPVATLTPSFQNISCLPASVTDLTATATSPTANVTHLFAAPFGGTLEINSSTAFYRPGSPGTYTYFLKDHENGCTSSQTFAVGSSNAFPSLYTSSTQNFSLGCGTKSIAVININNLNSNPPGNPLSYSVNGISTPTTITSFTTTTPGTWTLTLKDNINTCETTLPFSVTQNTIAPGLFALVPTQTLNCLRPQVPVEGFGSITNVDINWAITSPTWPSLPAGATQIINMNPQIPGFSLLNTYTLFVQDLNNACTSNSVVPIYQNFEGPILVGSQSMFALCPGGSSIIIYPAIIGSSNNCIFSWTFPQSALVSGISTVSLQTNSPGNYLVTALNTVSSCSVSAPIVVDACVSIKEKILLNEIHFYPNPFKAMLRFEFNNAAKESLQISITNALGQIIYASGLLNTELVSDKEIDLNDIKSGIYYLKIKRLNEHTTFKIVKE